jgi:hypothetical protein
MGAGVVGYGAHGLSAGVNGARRGGTGSAARLSWPRERGQARGGRRSREEEERRKERRKRKRKRKKGKRKGRKEREGRKGKWEKIGKRLENF